jgi:hypothetical protein
MSLISRRRLFGTALAASGVGAATLLTASNAAAICLTQVEDGLWQNINPHARSIHRIRLRFVCQDVILNGKPYPPGAPWYVRVWGVCHPSDCVWSEVPARRVGGAILASYDHGFAARRLVVRAAPGGRLIVRMHTNFRDGRRDYDTFDLFRRIA